MNSSPVPQKKTSTLAILSLVFSFLCMPVGAILSVIALVRISKNPLLGGRGLAIAGLAISGSMILCIPVGAAIAIPNFMKFQARAKQSECKVMLKEALVLESSREEGFTTQVEQLGLERQPNQRYAYFLASPVIAEGAKANVSLPAEPADLHVFQQALAQAGVELGATGEGFTFACVGNVDSDDTLDVWSISNVERPGIPAGVPHHEVDDVME